MSLKSLRGKRSNLYFWQDSKRNEVDLLVESGTGVMPVEIKSGATINDDFFKGLQTFADRVPNHSLPSLVYGGTERQKRSKVRIWRASDVAEMMGRSG